MNFWVFAWLRAFALTLAIELPVATPLLLPAERSRGRRVVAVAIANLATHPLVWFAFPGLAFGHTVRLASSEIWAVLVEAAIYRFMWPALSLRRATMVSLAANAASLTVGEVLAHFAAVR